MQLYTDYINHYMSSIPGHSYVFINLTTTEPLNYRAVRQFFLRLSHKLGFLINPHMFRHTHATELIRHGWDATLVHKRLGHASIQTTLDIYAHLDTNDLKHAYQHFLNNRSKQHGDNSV